MWLNTDLHLDHSLEQDKLSAWASFINKAFEGDKSFHNYIYRSGLDTYHLYSKSFPIITEQMDRLTSLEIIQKTQTFVEKATTSRGADQAIAILKTRIQAKYFSGITGTIKKIASFVFPKLKFERTIHAQELRKLEQAIQNKRIANQFVDDTKEEKEPSTKINMEPRTYIQVLQDRLQKMGFPVSPYNSDASKDSSYSPLKFAPKNKPIAIKKSKSPGDSSKKQAAIDFAYKNGIKEEHVAHLKAMEQYLMKLADKLELDIDPDYYSDAANQYIKLSNYWFNLELLYKKENLKAIEAVKQFIPEYFRKRHMELLASLGH